MGLQGFMGKISKQENGDKLWENYCYIAANEWCWSPEDIMEAPIPLVLQLLEKRQEVKKAEERAAKKGR